MPILGVIVRTRPGHTAAVRQRLAARPGIDIALDPGDGRLILVIEDSATTAAAAAMADIAAWPEVASTSLAYEYSGPDAPSPDGELAAYADWRDGLDRLARRGPAS